MAKQRRKNGTSRRGCGGQLEPKRRRKRRGPPVQKFAITDALWERLEPLLPVYPVLEVGGRPRLSLRNVANAIFFVMRTGCQWLALKRDAFQCSGRSAHRYFQEWTDAGVFETLWRNGLTEYDELKGIQWTWQPADGAMVKAPLGGPATGPNPTDRAKLGTKRSLQTDAAGVPIGIVIDGANRNDHKLLEATIKSTPVRRPSRKKMRQHLPLDKGYDYPATHDLVRRLGFESHIALKTTSTTKRVRTPGRRKPRRWVVERTHGWMNRFRRILVRWEKRDTNYLGLLCFVCAIIAYRAAGVLA